MNVLTQNFANDKFRDFFYEVLLETMNKKGESITMEQLKADSEVAKMANVAVHASAISLTLDLICSKLNITEEDWMTFQENYRSSMVSAGLTG